MTAVAAGGAVCAALVAAMLRILRGPLLAVLTELCAGEARARFWWRVLTVEVAAGTAICGSLAILGGARESWEATVAMLRGGSAGLLVSLGVVAAAVLAFQREVDRSRRDGSQVKPRRSSQR